MATLRDFNQPERGRYRVTHRTDHGLETIECIFQGSSFIHRDGGVSDWYLDLPDKFEMVPGEIPEVTVPAHRFIWLSDITEVETA